MSSKYSIECRREASRVLDDLERIFQNSIDMFCPPPNDVPRRLRVLFYDIVRQPDASPFLAPVLCPDYLSKVPHPMCFADVETKLRTGLYLQDPTPFVEDVRQIFTNCYEYHGITNVETNTFVKQAVKLELLFEDELVQQLRDFLPRPSVEEFRALFSELVAQKNLSRRQDVWNLIRVFEDTASGAGYSSNASTNSKQVNFRPSQLRLATLRRAMRVMHDFVNSGNNNNTNTATKKPIGTTPSHLPIQSKPAAAGGKPAKPAHQPSSSILKPMPKRKQPQQQQQKEKRPRPATTPPHHNRVGQQQQDHFSRNERGGGGGEGVVASQLAGGMRVPIIPAVKPTSTDFVAAGHNNRSTSVLSSPEYAEGGDPEQQQQPGQRKMRQGKHNHAQAVFENISSVPMPDSDDDHHHHPYPLPEQHNNQQMLDPHQYHHHQLMMQQQQQQMLPQPPHPQEIVTGGGGPEAEAAVGVGNAMMATSATAASAPVVAVAPAPATPQPLNATQQAPTPAPAVGAESAPAPTAPIQQPQPPIDNPTDDDDEEMFEEM